MMIDRVVWSLVGLVLGAIAGFIVALPILLLTDRLGITNHVEDVPLHGWLVFVAILDGLILVGACVGAVTGWRRGTLVKRSTQPPPVTNTDPTA
ncbi:MAG: hypothetical protein ACXWZF_09995 [Actinomycetota bacterium]